MQKQPSDSIASHIWEKLRALFTAPPVESVERVRELSSDTLRAWVAAQASKYPGHGCVLMLAKKRDALTAVLIDQTNEFVFDEKGKRVAKRFEFGTLSADLQSLLAGDELVVLTF